MNTSSDKNLPDLPLSFDNDQTEETEILFTSLSSFSAWSCTYSLKCEFVKYATILIFINVVVDKLIQKCQKCEIQLER